MHFVVAYDICTDSKAGEKRLRRVAQLCVNHGQRVQQSVFECELDDVLYAGFVHQLQNLIHPAEDSVRIYRVHDFSGRTLIALGRQIGIDFDQPIIL